MKMGAVRLLGREIRDFVQKRKELIVITAASALVLFLIHYVLYKGIFSQVLTDHLGLVMGNYRLTTVVYWSAGSIIVYLFIPLMALAIIGKRPAEYGLTLKGYASHLPYYLFLYLPVGILIFAASFRVDFQMTYPMYGNPESWFHLLVWELAYALQFIALEFFFRGFMLQGFKREFGAVAATVIMILPYMMIHFTKPWLEASGSIILGIILSVLAFRTRSIAGGVTMHLLIAFSVDGWAIWQKGLLQ